MSHHEQAEEEFSLKSYFTPLTTTKAIHFIVIIGILVFANSLFNGFVGDDEGQIIGNVLTQSLTNIPLLFHSVLQMDTSTSITTYYKPITFSTITLLYSFFGLSPFFYHLLQVMLHITNSIFVYLLFKKFVRNVLGFCLALVFLIHPINAETVSYLADLQDVLFMFFGLLAMRLLIMERTSYGKCILLGCSLLASYLSKETGVAFVIVVPLYNYFFIRKQNIQVFVTVCISFLVYLFLRFSSQPIASSGLYTSAISTLNFQQRILSIPKILLHYFHLFFYPNQLAIGWNWTVTNISFMDFLLPLMLDSLFILPFLIYLLFLYKKKSSNFKAYCFFAIWFVLGMLLHLQFIPLDFTVADRWFYFPLVGLLGMLALGIGTIHSISIKTRKIVIVTFCLILICLSLRTLIRNANFHDNITLYSHDLKIVPDNSVLENGLGVAYSNVGNLSAAKLHYEQSIKLDNHSESWNNLGVVFIKTSNLRRARECFQNSITLSDFELAFENLAQFNLTYDTPLSAKRIAKQGLEKYPDKPKLWFILAQAEYKLGNKKESLTDAQKSFKLAPDEDVYYFLKKIAQLK